MRNERGSALPWLFGLLVLAGLLILFMGTGVFRNWGKRDQEEAAEKALYNALLKIEQGDTSDWSAMFPQHPAGRACLAIYEFLRQDEVDTMLLPTVLEGLPAKPALTKVAAAKDLEMIEPAVLAVKRMAEDREARAGKLLLVLKNHGRSSDRLHATHLRIERDFTETDNVYGGREKLLDLEISRLTHLITIAKKTLGEKPDPNPIATDIKQHDLVVREIGDVRAAMTRAIAAEREGARRRLAL